MENDEKSRFSIWWDSLTDQERDGMSLRSAFEAAEEIMEDRSESTELFQAYTWTCGECGIDNWQRCVSKVLDHEDPYDADVMRTMLGLEPDESIPSDAMIGCQTYPNKVTCSGCQKTYRTTTPGDLRSDDDQG